MLNKRLLKVRIVFIAALFCCLFFLSGASGLLVKGESVKSAEVEPSFRMSVIDGKNKFLYSDDIINAPNHMIEEEIYNRRINAPLKQKMIFVDSLIKRGLTIADSIKVAFPKMERFVSGILISANKAPVNSEIIFKPDSKETFSFTPEENGVACDERRLYQDIYLQLKENSVEPIYLIKRQINPIVTRKMNIENTKALSSFSTAFVNSPEPRRNNIILALSKLNGQKVDAGQSISFNKTVGARTEAAGFKKAKIIVNGKYIEGMGGGVCQVSTTLYNAAIRGGMDAEEVHHHSLAPSYVPPSLDAMVSGSQADLVLKNTSKNSIFIKAYAKDGHAFIELFSRPLEYKIIPESVIISKGEPPCDNEIIDVDYLYVSPLSPPKTRVRVSYGIPEVKSEAYAVYFNAQKQEVGRKFLRRDSYKSYPGIVAVAPEKKAQNDG